MDLCSSVSPTPPTEPPNLSISMMTIAAESSSKEGWVRKLRPILLDNNSKDMSSESTEDSTRTDSP